MPTILKDNMALYPVWIAIGGQDKLVCAQDQTQAVQCFILHYGISPTLVINGLYAAKNDKKLIGIN